MEVLQIPRSDAEHCLELAENDVEKAANLFFDLQDRSQKVIHAKITDP